MPAVRVLIAGQPLMVAGLQHLLKDKFMIVGMVFCRNQAVSLCSKLHPDVLLLESDFGERDILDVMSRILKSCPKVKVVLIAPHAQRAVFNRAMEMGVPGFVLKEQDPLILCTAIETVAAGGTYTDPFVWKLPQRTRRPEELANGSLQPTLTRRQLEVLQLIASGHTNRKIATLLGIATKTAEFHRSVLMRVLGLHTVAELSRFAMQIGLVGTLRGFIDQAQHEEEPVRETFEWEEPSLPQQ